MDVRCILHLDVVVDVTNISMHIMLEVWHRQNEIQVVILETFLLWHSDLDASGSVRLLSLDSPLKPPKHFSKDLRDSSSSNSHHSATEDSGSIGKGHQASQERAVHHCVHLHGDMRCFAFRHRNTLMKPRQQNKSKRGEVITRAARGGA